MIQQLNPPIPVITPKGKALAHFVIDYGIESELQWVCFQDSTGESWTWQNPKVRAQMNITHGRDYISPFYHPSEVAFKKEEEDEEVQGEEFEEECEEEEDDDSSEDSFYSDYLTEKSLREKAEKKLEEVTKFYKDLEKKTETFEATRKAIFELQDLVMRLIKFKKIDAMEWPHVINILRNTGVEQGDIKVLCNIEEPIKKPRK